MYHLWHLISGSWTQRVLNPSSSALSQRSAAGGRECESAQGSVISHRRLFHPQFIQDCCGIKWDIRKTAIARRIDVITMAWGWRPPEGICWVGGKQCWQPRQSHLLSAERLIQPHLVRPLFGFWWLKIKWHHGHAFSKSTVRLQWACLPLGVH